MNILDKHTELKGGFLQPQEVHCRFIPKHNLPLVRHVLWHWKGGKLFQVTEVIFSIYFEQNHHVIRNQLLALAAGKARLLFPYILTPRDSYFNTTITLMGNIHTKSTMPF